MVNLDSDLHLPETDKVLDGALSTFPNYSRLTEESLEVLILKLS